MATGDTAVQQQLKTLQESLKHLRGENDALRARLAVIDPEAGLTTQPEVDVDSLLDDADAIMKSTGSHAILRLRQALEEGGAESLTKALRQVLKSPYLDENDFAEIVLLCQQTRLNEHRRATLEVARRRYPHSDRLFMAFVDALDDSPNVQEQERGRVMLEQQLKVEYHADKPRLSASAPISGNLVRSVGLLFNFYNRQHKWEWVLSIWDSLPEPLRNDPMLLRNRARSLAELQRLEEAQRVFEQAMELEPTNDQTLVWYSGFLDDRGKYAEAYALSERAILADPEDPRLYIHMAILIFNRGYVRMGTGRIEGPLPRNGRAKVAVPFVLRAVEIGTDATVEEAVRILVRAGAMAEAKALAGREAPKGKYDTAPLEFLVKRTDAQDPQSQ